MGEIILLDNSFIRFQHGYLTIGEKSVIDVTDIRDRKVTFTDGYSVIINKLYSITLLDSETNKEFKLGFVFDISRGTYSHVEFLEKDGKIFMSPRFHQRYIRIVCELVYAIRLQTESINVAK